MTVAAAVTTAKHLYSTTRMSTIPSNAPVTSPPLPPTTYVVASPLRQAVVAVQPISANARARRAAQASAAWKRYPPVATSSRAPPGSGNSIRMLTMLAVLATLIYNVAEEGHVTGI